MEFRDAINNDFKKDLIKDGYIQASSVRGYSYGASNMQDDNYNTFWAAEDNVLTASIEIDLKEEKRFNRLLLQEYIPLGQRVSSFTVKWWDSNKKDWIELAEATTIGYKRILRFPVATTSKIKIEFDALACPVISKIAAFLGQEFLTVPLVERSKSGIVTIKSQSSDPIIYYTTNGDEPVVSPENKYNGEFLFKDGGIVKAISTIEDGNKKSNVVTRTYDIASEKWKIISPKEIDISKIADDNNRTYIEVGAKEPLIIDLGEVFTLKGLSYTPVPNMEASNIAKCKVFISDDGQNWEKDGFNTDFNNIRNNPVRQDIAFPNAVKGRYIKIVPKELTTKKDKYTVAELSVVTR
ncbi:MAG: discoidin domain-containing protein [Dysgonomonas sp.]